VPHQKVIGKFHSNRIPAHVASMPIGCFRELLFGTVPESAASADRRRKLRRTRRVGPNAVAEFFTTASEQ